MHGLANKSSSYKLIRQEVVSEESFRGDLEPVGIGVPFSASVPPAHTQFLFQEAVHLCHKTASLLHAERQEIDGLGVEKGA